MSAPVTEAHRKLIHQLLMNVEHGYLKEAAQLIADSEAKAVALLTHELEAADLLRVEVQQERDELRAEVDAQCLLNAKGSEREAVLLGRVDRMAKECLNLRGEMERLREWQAGVIANERLHYAERKDAIARAEKAEAELSAEQDTRSCVEAELARELARLRKVAIAACKEAQIKPVVWYPKGSSIDPNNLGKINEQQVDACVAAIDAAMKEGDK